METKIITESEDEIKITIDEFCSDGRLALQGYNREIVYIPLESFDKIVDIVAKYRAAKAIINPEK